MKKGARRRPRAAKPIAHNTRPADSVSVTALADRPPPIVTVRRLAALLGLSKSTVAGALNGQVGYAAGTVAKVKTMAETLGYRPNPLVTANMVRIRDTRGRSEHASTLAYLSDIGRAELLKPGCHNYAGYLGARERAFELGFGLDLIDYAQAGMNSGRLRNVIRSRGIRGLVIAPHTQPQIELDLGWDEFATVCIGFSVVSPRFDRVGYDHHEAIIEVCRRMCARGHQRLGLVMSEDFDARVLHITRAGFMRWQWDHDGNDVPALLIRSENRDTLAAWYRKHKPDCIIAPGVNIVEELSHIGIETPRDVVVTTTMHLPQHAELGGFDISLRSLARSAVDLVAAKLYRNEKGVPQMRQTVLVLGTFSDPVFSPLPPCSHRSEEHS